ncbi:MAG: serine/threonine-protein kinase [Thermoanaerobaculia bacterium]|nr:serine/threonine-protein kinase [Thermoanaerobaculia bacterium]
MEGPSWERVERLLDDALDLEAEERGALLDDACGDDRALRDKVERLLAASDRLDGFLDRPVFEDAAEALSGLAEDLLADAAPDLSGRPVGAYRLLEPLGSGGMGTVYLAERDDDQYRQRVAVKLLPQAMADPAAALRFRTERQILATLEHPNIARLLDGGVTTEGIPFLVMELVDGKPIDAYCRHHALDVRDRIGLFLAVCDAVDHAHRHLVVHRDLKPANILVDGDGRPRLLDFGIGKLMEGAAADLTRTGSVLLTPAYASPEQLRGDPVGTQSDVFALGILLYLLLTDTHPFRDHDTDREVREAVLAEEPRPPSVAVDRRTEAGGRSLRSRLRGDLDTITLTALHKEPERRYSSVARLAEDLQRHLEGLPIRARPASTAYRLRKFVARNIVGVAAAATLTVAIVLGLAGTLWQAREAGRERDAARTQALRAERTAAFLAGLFEGADPGRTGGTELSAGDLLERGVRTLDEGLGDEPLVRADLLATIAVAEGDLGLLDRSVAHLEEVVSLHRDAGGPEKELAVGLTELGLAYLAKGRYEAAREALEEALAIRGRLLGSESLEYAHTLHGLGLVAKKSGDLEAAREAHGESLRIRRLHLDPPHAELALALQSYASDHARPETREEAVRLFREAIAMWERLGDPHLSERATAQNDLGIFLHGLGQLEAAVEHYRAGLETIERLYGPDHPEVADGLTNLGKALMDEGRFGEAEPVLRRAVELNGRFRAPTHFDRIGAEINLGSLLVEQGRFEEGAALYADALDRFRLILGPDHAFVGMIEGYLGRALLLAGRVEEAARSLERGLEILGSSTFASDSRITVAQLGRACLWRQQGRIEESVAALEQVLVSRRADFPNWRTAEAEIELAEALRLGGERERALELATSGYATLAATRGVDDWLTRRAAEVLQRLDAAVAPPPPDHSSALRPARDHSATGIASSTGSPSSGVAKRCRPELEPSQISRRSHSKNTLSALRS